MFNATAHVERGAPEWTASWALFAPYPGQQEVPGGAIGGQTYSLSATGSPEHGSTNSYGPGTTNAASIAGGSHAYYVAVGLAVPGVAVVVTIEGGATTATVTAAAAGDVFYFNASDTDANGVVTVAFAAGGHAAAVWLYSRAAADAVTQADDGGTGGAPAPLMPTRHPAPPDLGARLAFIDCGSGDDVPAATPIMNHTVAAPGAGNAVSILMHLPPTAKWTAGTTNTSQCAADPAALLRTTFATWEARLGGSGGNSGGGRARSTQDAEAVLPMFSVPDARTMRAVAVATMQLVMMTERQPDGLRCLKGPIHYYGSDPYDTYRITTAFQRLGMFNLSRAILTRQLKQRCTNGMWQMWEQEKPPADPGLYIVRTA